VASSPPVGPTAASAPSPLGTAASGKTPSPARELSHAQAADGLGREAAGMRRERGTAGDVLDHAVPSSIRAMPQAVGIRLVKKGWNR
jgi:hypothetical protein